MVTLYHGTSTKRLKSILESGLIPPKCPVRHTDVRDECDCGYREDEHGNFDYERNYLKGNFGFVYLSKEAWHALSWSNYSGWDGDDVVLAVKIRKADVEPDPIVAGAWRTRGPIPPERISIYEGSLE